jgi:hypothetical protein
VKGGIMSLTDVAENSLFNVNNITKDGKRLKFGLCPFSDNCYLYVKYDFHCDKNRGLFLRNGSTIPSCYQEKKEE